MKKLISNSNLYILLLAPILLGAVAIIYYQTLSFKTPEMEIEIIGLFNKRTIFEVLCQALVNLKW